MSWEHPRQALDTTRNKSQACFWYTLQFSSALFQCCLHRRASCHLMVLQELSMPPAVPNHGGTMWRYYISFATCGCNVPGWHSESKFHDNGIAKPHDVCWWIRIPIDQNLWQNPKVCHSSLYVQYQNVEHIRATWNRRMLLRRFDMVWPIPSHLSFTPLHGFHSTLALGAAKKQSSRYVATPTDQTSTLAPGEKGIGWVEDRSMAAPTVASLTSRPIHTCRLWHEPSVSPGCLMTLSVFLSFPCSKAVKHIRKTLKCWRYEICT